MKRAFLPLLVLAGFLSTAVTTPTPIWIVDKAASQVGFRATVAGEGFNGSFHRWDARIRFDPAALATSTVIATIETASATTGDRGRDEALPTADWFNSVAFPRAIFEARRFESLGGGRYRGIGTLAIRNIKRPVILPFQLVIRGKRAQMRGTLQIDRRAFGVGQGQFSTADTVAANVTINIVVTATRQS